MHGFQIFVWNFKGSHKILNPYTSKYALYEVFQVRLSMISYDILSLSETVPVHRRLIFVSHKQNQIILLKIHDVIWHLIRNDITYAVIMIVTVDVGAYNVYVYLYSVKCIVWYTSVFQRTRFQRAPSYQIVRDMFFYQLCCNGYKTLHMITSNLAVSRLHKILQKIR